MVALELMTDPRTTYNRCVISPEISPLEQAYLGHDSSRFRYGYGSSIKIDRVHSLFTDELRDSAGDRFHRILYIYGEGAERSTMGIFLPIPVSLERISIPVLTSGPIPQEKIDEILRQLKTEVLDGPFGDSWC